MKFGILFGAPKSFLEESVTQDDLTGKNTWILKHFEASLAQPGFMTAAQKTYFTFLTASSAFPTRANFFRSSCSLGN